LKVLLGEFSVGNGEEFCVEDGLPGDVAEAEDGGGCRGWRWSAITLGAWRGRLWRKLLGGEMECRRGEQQGRSERKQMGETMGSGQIAEPLWRQYMSGLQPSNFFFCLNLGLLHPSEASSPGTPVSA
jgi:hypothetical protein